MKKIYSCILFLLIVITVPAAAQWLKMDTNTPQTLRGAWIAPDMTLYAVGDAGTILIYNGLFWTPMQSKTTNMLFDIWGSSSDMVAACGWNTVLLYNGKNWKNITPAASNVFYTPIWVTPDGQSLWVGQPDFSGLGFDWLYRYDITSRQWNSFATVVAGAIMAFCGSDNDITMVLENGDIKHADNNLTITDIYSSSSPLGLQAAWINPSDCREAFGVNSAGTIYYFNGSSWENMQGGISDSIWGIHGTSSSNVYAVGINSQGKGVVWFYNGSKWKREKIPSVRGLIDVNVVDIDTGGAAGVLDKHDRILTIGEGGAGLGNNPPKGYRGSWTGLVDWDDSRRKYISDVQLYSLMLQIPKEVKRLLIFSQCYGGEFAKSPLFQFSHTATMSASGPDETSIYGGFHLGVSGGAKPEEGRTAQTIYDDGMANAYLDGSGFETTEMKGGGLDLKEFHLDPVTETGKVRSRHIIIYCGKPGIGKKKDRKTGKDLGEEVSDKDDRDRIKKNFRNEPHTTIYTVGGPPASSSSPNETKGTDGWDYRGDFHGLAQAFRRVKEDLDKDKAAERPLDKEQFILYVGDHGEYKRSKNSVTIPPVSSRTTAFTTIDASARFRNALEVDMENQPAFEFVLPYDDLNVKVQRDAGGNYIPFYAQGDFFMEIIPPPGKGSPDYLSTFFERYCDDGDDILGNQPGEGVLLRFAIDETIFLDKYLNGAPVDIVITNNTSSAVYVGVISQSTGTVSRGPHVKKHTLTIAATAGGTTDPPPGTYYPEGEVTIIPLPDPDYLFIGWSGDVPAGQENYVPLTITMDTDKSITANFRADILPPLNFTAQKIFNRSLFKAEYINILRWQANPNNVDIVSYRIYRVIDGSWDLAGEVGAGVFQVWDRNVSPDREYRYALVAVNTQAQESSPVFVTVK